MSKAGDDAADQIKGDVLHMTVGLLDVVAEDEEKEHVSADVQPTAVHEDRGQERQPYRHRSRRFVDDRRRPVGQHQMPRADDVDAVRDLRRHGGVPIREVRIGELIEEDDDVDRDDREVDVGNARPTAGVLVADRDHGCILRRLASKRQFGLVRTGPARLGTGRALPVVRCDFRGTAGGSDCPAGHPSGSDSRGAPAFAAPLPSTATA